ncbi:hypothetical protein [Cellvibrio japonicus]|nr:hypothetical protein [Cellvibrio japonicus]
MTSPIHLPPTQTVDSRDYTAIKTDPLKMPGPNIAFSYSSYSVIRHFCA